MWQIHKRSAVFLLLRLDCFFMRAIDVYNNRQKQPWSSSTVTRISCTQVKCQIQLQWHMLLKGRVCLLWTCATSSTLVDVNCWKETSQYFEVYDGQWKNVTFNEAGEPLTLLQMFKKNWDAVSRMSKDRIIQEVMKLSQIMAGDLDIMTYTYHFDVSITTLANIWIRRNTSGPLEIELLGGQKYRESIMSFIKTCYLQKLWTGEYEGIPEDQSSKVNKKMRAIFWHFFIVIVKFYRQFQLKMKLTLKKWMYL